MPELTPHITMNCRAHYVTQSSIYDTPLLGPLTDRRIAKYQKSGYYDGIKRDERKAKRTKKQNILKLLLS